MKLFSDYEENYICRFYEEITNSSNEYKVVKKVISLTTSKKTHSKKIGLWQHIGFVGRVM